MHSSAHVEAVGPWMLRTQVNELPFFLKFRSVASFFWGKHLQILTPAHRHCAYQQIGAGEDACQSTGVPSLIPVPWFHKAWFFFGKIDDEGLFFFGGLPKNSWEIREPKFISNLAGSLLKTNTSVLWSAFLRQPYIHHWAICSLDPRGNPSYLRKSMLQNWFK